MNIRYPPEADQYRKQVREFIAASLPVGWQGVGALDGAAYNEFVDRWRGTLYDHGFLAPSWPQRYGGGGLTPLETVVLAEELAGAGLPSGGPNDAFSISMLGNTLLRWGSDDQKSWFLPRLLSGEDVWCQGYSEPDAGSDLGNLGLRAALDGDEWVLNGQKIWTTNAHRANWIFVLVRTDPDAPKHRGISFMLCPLDQPGIEVRPIGMMSGPSEFNEVYFNNARTPAEHVVGSVNGGWAVAMTLIGQERGSASATLHIRYRVELDRLTALARSKHLDRDPLIRQRLAWCYTQVEIMRFLGYRALTSYLHGAEPGPEASITKLLWSEYHQVVTNLAMNILGPEALCPSGRPPSHALGPDDTVGPGSSASWAGVFLNARAGTIYAGSSQIQRNTLGELVLGLPKEPRADAGPWNARSKQP